MIIKILKYLLIFFATILVMLFGVYLYVDSFIEVKDSYLDSPKTGEYINIDGNDIYYEYSATNTKKNIVLVGGTAAWSGVWEKTINDLKNEYNVYALDLPPFGYSVVKNNYTYSLENQTNVILGFINYKKINDAIVVSHSYGSGPSIEAAFRGQENISKLVIIDGVIHLEKNEMSNSFAKTILEKTVIRNFITKILLHIPNFIDSRIESFVYKPEQVNEYWISKYTAPLDVEGTSEKLGKWIFDFTFGIEEGMSNNPDNYSNLKTPVLIIWGEKDTLTPLKQGQNLDDIIPNSKIIILPETGHIPMIDNFEAFSRVLKENL